MDQKIAVGGTIFTAIITFFCALMVIPVGVGMLFSYPDKIWWLGIVLLACGYAFIKSGIANLKRSNRMQKQVEANLQNVAETLHQIKQQTALVVSSNALSPSPEVIEQSTSPQPAATTVNKIEVLAHWIFTNEEWSRFTRWEIKERKSNTTIEAVALVVLGSVTVQWMRAPGWFISISISVFIGIIYWLGKYFLSMASIGKATGKQNEIVITREAIIINGKYNAFRNEMYSLQDINIKRESTPEIMEIVYQWNTRSGASHDEIRIPIPAGKSAEAALVARMLKGF